VVFGAAGVAYAFYRQAIVLDDPKSLALAETWISRAKSAVTRPTAFYDAQNEELAPSTLGQASLYFTEPGVHVVRALVANASGDDYELDRAVRAFVRTAQRPCADLDLNLGIAGLLLGASMLREILPPAFVDCTRLLQKLGTSLTASLQQALRTLPEIPHASDVLGLGVAHGWAGVLFALLRWTRVSGGKPDGETVSWLRVLGEAARPAGRGLRWPWHEGVNSQSAFVSGWCNGSAGFVFLWLLAHETLRSSDALALAEGAAWNAWEGENGEAGSLCCGLTGRSYALMAMYRATGDGDWYRKARTLAAEAEDALDEWERATPSLFKGALGPALLKRELNHPEIARFPMFEAEGWPLRS